MILLSCNKLRLLIMLVHGGSHKDRIANTYQLLLLRRLLLWLSRRRCGRLLDSIHEIVYVDGRISGRGWH